MLMSAVVWPAGGCLVLLIEALFRYSMDMSLPLDDYAWGAFGWLEWSLLAPVAVFVTLRTEALKHRTALVGTHLLGAFAVSAAHSAVFFAARHAVLGYWGEPGETLRAAWLAHLAAYFLLDSAVYIATVITVRGLLYAQHAVESRETAVELRRRISTADLLRARLLLQPRMVEQFLLRIEDCVTRDIAEAETLIEHLAVLLRRSLAALRPAHTVGDEVRHAQAFLRAEAALNGPGPDIRFAMDDLTADLDATLPALLPILTELVAASRRSGVAGCSFDVDVFPAAGSVVLELRLPPELADGELRDAIAAMADSLSPEVFRADARAARLWYRAPLGAEPADPSAGPPDNDADTAPTRSPIWALVAIAAYPASIVAAANVLGVFGDYARGLRPTIRSLWDGLAGQTAVLPIAVFVIWIANLAFRDSTSDQWRGKLATIVGLATAGPTVAVFLWYYAQARGGVFDALQRAALSHDRTLDFLTILGAALAMMSRTRRQELALRRADVVELRTRLRETRIQLLMLQLNPHFLFNALNSIAALVDDDPISARDMAAQLRRFLRRVLLISSEGLVSLTTELELLNDYVAIQRTRFGERLAVSFDIQPAAERCFVPALLLQPLVENAVKHGLAPVDGGRVEVSVRLDDALLTLRVSDNGIGSDTSGELDGLGLATTRMRLQSYYGDRAETHVETPAVGYAVTITVPVNP
jgi:two-component sensor histidine kinase